MKTADQSKKWLAPALILAAFLAVFVAFLWPRSQPNFSTEQVPGFKTITLKVSSNGLTQLQAKRDEALRIGVLQTKPGDWVEAALSEGNHEFHGKIRLKGDWTDHLQGEKWSYRVKLSKGNAWCGMSVFSLQNPESRNFLMEWLFHQFLKKEGVLTTQYDFVRLKINDQDLGIYALEEHFTPSLLAAQRRPEGPILKMSEAGIWEIRAAELTRNEAPNCELNVFAAATIQPFVDLEDASPETVQQFELAANLLDQARFRVRPHRELFDMELAAKRHAATDLFKAFHSLTWHNQRWYYNPFLGKLEPVVYDGYPGTDLRYQFQGPFSGYQASGLHIDERYSELMDAPFYQDSLFLHHYYGALSQYTQANYIQQTLDSFRIELSEREAFIRKEFIFYEFDPGFLSASGKNIREVFGTFASGKKLKQEKIKGKICFKNEFPFPVILSEMGGWGRLLHAKDPDYPSDSVLVNENKIWRIEIPGFQNRILVDGWW